MLVSFFQAGFGLRFLLLWVIELRGHVMTLTCRMSYQKCWLTRIASDNKGWSRIVRKSCFPMSLTSSSSSRAKNKYGRIWSGLSTSSKNALCYCDAIYRQVFRCVNNMNHILPYHEGTTMTWDIGKHDIRSVVLHSLLSNANRFTRGVRGHFVTITEVAMHLFDTILQLCA